MAALLTTTIKRGGDLKQTSTSTRLGAADLVLPQPQPVPLCLKFSSDGEKREFFCGVLGTITGFPIIPLMNHPDIHSLSPYQLIKY